MVNATHSLDIGAALELDPAPSVRQALPVDSVPQPPQFPEYSRGQIAALFAVFACVIAVPILLHPLPPLSDYINHLARMHIIAAIGGDPDLTRFYEVDWQVIPNLMMDMVLPVLMRIMSIYQAGQAYTIASFLLIATGTFALNRALLGRWSVLPLAAFPLLYNYVFLVGTMNYVSGIGLSLWALVAWIGLRERNLALRLGVSTLFLVGLFFCHLYAVGIYGVALLAYELHRLGAACVRRFRRQPSARDRTLISLILDFVASGAPFLLVLPLLTMSPTWGLRGSVSWEWPGKVDGLVYAFDVYSDTVAFVLVAGAIAVAGFALWNRALRFHAFGVVLLAVGGAVYLVMPRIVFDTYMADQRLPISLVFMVIGCAQLDLSRLALRYPLAPQALLAVLAVLLGLRVLEVQTTWNELSGGTSSFRQSIDLVDRGAKVLVAYADPDGGDDVRNLGLVHAACLAIIERSALVTTVFSVVGKQILHVRPDYRARVDTQDGSPPTINSLVHAVSFADTAPSSEDYWARWTSDYDYLYVLFTSPGYENPDPERLTPIFGGDQFVLYRIEHTQVADARRSAK